MTKVCPIVIVEWSIPENGIGKTHVDQSKQVMEPLVESINKLTYGKEIDSFIKSNEAQNILQ